MLLFPVAYLLPKKLLQKTFLCSETEVHGFYELRSGYQTRKDKYQKDMSVMEQRLQVDITSYFDWADIKVKGDITGDILTPYPYLLVQTTSLTNCDSWLSILSIGEIPGWCRRDFWSMTSITPCGIVKQGKTVITPHLYLIPISPLLSRFPPPSQLSYPLHGVVKPIP